jgi:hypothetical protein
VNVGLASSPFGPLGVSGANVGTHGLDSSLADEGNPLSTGAASSQDDPANLLRSPPTIPVRRSALNDSGKGMVRTGR